MNETLARQLAPHAVPPERLPADHRPLLAMLDELIGVTPNCYPVLAIWPPGLRTFNVLVPNLLNLPGALMGHGAPKDLVALALYASSQAAGCSYCIAHHCSYALRRGVDRDTVLGHHRPDEAAVVELAESMAAVPGEVTPARVLAVERAIGPADAGWVATAVALGGFLNKFMDAVGIELEEDCLNDVQAVLAPGGWRPGKHLSTPALDLDRPPDFDPEPGSEPGGEGLATWQSIDYGANRGRPAWARVDTSDRIPVDGLGTYLRVLRQAPGAARLERGWTRGVSGRIGEALLLLEERIGYAFPILASVSSPRVVRALATVLRDNLDPELTTVGIETKLLAGLVYAAHVDSPLLAQECTLLLDLIGAEPEPWRLRSIARFATATLEEAEVPPGLDLVEAAALLLARACASSPADISEIVVEAIGPHLGPEQVVELVVWLSVLQLLHRLYGFNEARALTGIERAAVI